MLITAKALAPRLAEKLISENPVLAGVRMGFRVAGGREPSAYDIIGLAVAKALAPTRADFVSAGQSAGMADAEAWANAESDHLIDLVMTELTGVPAAEVASAAKLAGVV
jgi:hypothetical protein